jgi:hypothetical protein
MTARVADPAGLAVVVTEAVSGRQLVQPRADVVGRKLVIANVPFTVVGVMPKRFIGADPTHKAADLCAAFRRPDHRCAQEPYLRRDPRMVAHRRCPAATRRHPGPGERGAVCSLRPILHQASDDASFIADEEKGHFHFVAEPGSRGFRTRALLFRKPLVAMFSMCGGNPAAGVPEPGEPVDGACRARERELATRLAIGATRRRLIQQLLAESLLIAILGTAAGLAVRRW